MIKLALFGSPIAHSLSPMIHQTFADQFSMALEYTLIETASENFESHLRTFIQNGGKGGNFTMPLKVKAFEFIRDKTPRALIAGSANTFSTQSKNFDEDSLICDNTDGAGFIQDLIKNHWELNGKRVLIIGWGAVAHAILEPLCQSGVKLVDIGIRNIELKQASFQKPDLKATISNPKNPILVTIISLEEVNRPYDIVINATSASMNNTKIFVNPICFKGAKVFDVVYKKESIDFLDWAKASGSITQRDGLGMLIEQAALAFEFWFDKKPDTSDLYDKLRY